MLAVGIGVALAIVIAALVALALPQPGGADHPTAVAQVLWMHSEASTSSGAERWYNFTLTVNQTIPLTALVFGLYNQNVPLNPPRTLSLTVVNVTIPIAEYNFTADDWTSGGSGALLSGDWIEVRIADQSLTGDRLVVIGESSFSSSCSVAFP